MTKKEILEELNSENTAYGVSQLQTLNPIFDITPQEFIKYAEYDLNLKYDHNIVNALSNAKRALDCQLDTILLVLGYYFLSQKKQWSFPKKIELIKELGIIAPRILKKVIKKRNLLEHQFIKPNKDEVEDFLDISMLFVASTEIYTLSFPKRIQLRNEKNQKTYLIKNNFENENFWVGVYPIGSFPALDKTSGEKITEEEKKKKESSKLHPNHLEEFSWNVNDIDFKEILKIYLNYIR